MSLDASDSSHQALAGCGQRLRQARLAAGLSVDDVADKLHMTARVVQSLESEDWSRLGAPVFVRGQVRSYSRLMGLTTAPMMAALSGIGPVEPARLVSRTHTPKAQWWAEQVGRRLGYIVFTLFLLVPAWMAMRQHLANPGVATPLDLPAPSQQRVGQAPMPSDLSLSPRTMVASMAPVSTTAVHAAGQAEIVLRTHGECWVTVIARDGSQLMHGLLPANSERRFAHGQVARMTVGNARQAEVEQGGRRVNAATSSHSNIARFTVSSEGSLVAAD